MVWKFFHSHGMYSGISLDMASVSSTGGLEVFHGPDDSEKMNMQDT
jgi:hypothetical protein